MPARTTVLAFDEWYEVIEPRLGRAVHGLVSDREVARDITAEALARAYRRWDHVGTAVAGPDAWVFRVAINLVRRSWRQRRTVPVPLPDGPDRRSDQSLDVDLWGAVARLPRRQRQVIVLRYVGDLAEAEIARVVGTSTGAVSASLARARATPRTALQEDLR